MKKNSKLLTKWRRKNKEVMYLDSYLVFNSRYPLEYIPTIKKSIIASTRMFVIGSRRNKKIKALQLRQSFKKVSEELGV
jgi:hypothetical protein